MAGHYYYVTEHYTEEVNGKTVRRTRQVRRTRWEHAAGRDAHFFDDELVVASKGLKPGLVRQLFPFDTTKLALYQPSFLAGWEAERYQIDLKSGWTIGRKLMDDEIRNRCAAKIPGDTYKNLNVSSEFSAVTFKHILLPIWIAAYHYKDKLYQFLVNGQTGKVSGTSPKSWIKITLFVLAIAAVVAGIYYLAEVR